MNRIIFSIYFFSALKDGASCNATCRVSRVTACHVAAYKGQEEILELLLKEGAQGDKRDAKGRQPAHLAALAGHSAPLQLLHAFVKSPRAFDSTISSYPETPPIDPADSDSWSHNHEKFVNLVRQKVPAATKDFVIFSNHKLF